MTTTVTFNVDSDTALLSDFPTTNVGSSTTILVSSVANSLIKFDISSIPASQTILSATLSLTRDNAGTPTVIGAYRMVRDWVEAEATWNIAQTAVNWGTAGANNTSSDYDPTLIRQWGYETAANETKNADITSVVSDWYDGTHTNYGIKLALISGDEVEAHSSEATSLVPTLSVTYRGPPIDYKLNGTDIDCGVQALWDAIPTGQNVDATQKTSPNWRRHSWSMQFCDMTTWETLEPTKGTSFSSLKTTGEDDPNTAVTYATGRVLDVTGRQVGHRMENVRVNFFVDIAS